MYDGGLEIPLIMRWPEGGITGGNRTDRLVSQVDFVPTLFELIDLELPSNIDGLSFANEMGEWRGTGKREYIHGAYLHETRCVRSTEFKYIQNYAPICDPSKPVELGERAVEVIEAADGADRVHDVGVGPRRHRELLAVVTAEAVGAGVAGFVHDGGRERLDEVVVVADEKAT
jgi:arylsulfatase A-like enzyme